MYYEVISQCTQSLKNLETCLDKAEQHAVVSVGCTRCVRERAAMVETIRAHVRSYVGLLGQQGLGERFLKP